MIRKYLQQLSIIQILLASIPATGNAQNTRQEIKQLSATPVTEEVVNLIEEAAIIY